MSRYNFNLEKKELLDAVRSPAVYEYNLAENMALLSNDVSVIRRFYQVEIQKYFKDVWLTQEATNKFMCQYIPGQAFAYFGIIPMIVQGKVNLVASNGFECKSDDKEIDDALNRIKDDAGMEDKFANGVYLESGLGDFAYRISYHKSIDNKPIIDIIEPQNLEVNYRCGKIVSFVVKEVSSDKPNYELREIHYKDDAGYCCIKYKFYKDGKYVPDNDEWLIKECRQEFEGFDTEPQSFPFKDWLIIYKQNTNLNKLYRGERGVPDIQGCATIEDALTESISDLIDAIRKGGIKEFVSDELIPQDENGNDMRLNHFNKTIITTKGSSNPANPTSLWQVTQGQINWEAYTRTIQNLMSIAINKAGLAPTTLGLTGLESINSSAESQDTREKTSMRTREIALRSWARTLKELFNRYLQVCDYIAERDIGEYKNLINITFDEYTTPTLENITQVLAQQVGAGIKSRQSAIKDLNEGLTEEQVEQEFLRIQQENGANVLPQDMDETIDDNNEQETIEKTID